MSDVPVWNCEFFEEGDNVKGAGKLESLTVGAKLGLKCSGDIAVMWNPNQEVKIEFPPGPPDKDGQTKPDQALTFSLKVLKTLQLNPQSAQFEVTPYRAGEFQPKYVRLMQGEQGIEAANLKWKVQSVLQPGQQPQMVPSFGPYGLHLPIWITAAAISALVLVIWFVARRTRRYTQRRRMLEELKTHSTALLPLNQFYRDARQIRKRINEAKDSQELKPQLWALNRDFKLYVLRQFHVPALDWSDREILNDLKKHNRKVHDLAGDTLKRTLRELGRIQTRDGVQAQDVEQIHRMCLDTAERLEESRQ